jgi:hypothetical protein
MTSAEAYDDFELYCRAELRMRDRDIPRLRTFIDRCKAATMDDAKRSADCSAREFLAAWWRGDAGPVPCGDCSA